MKPVETGTAWLETSMAHRSLGPYNGDTPVQVHSTENNTPLSLPEYFVIVSGPKCDGQTTLQVRLLSRFHDHVRKT